MVHLLLDRVVLTETQNVLVVSLGFRRRSVPLVWRILPHQGSSTLRDQQLVLRAAAKLLPPAGVEALQPHLLALNVDRLNHVALLSQLDLAHKSGVWLHIRASHRNEAYARVFEQAGLIYRTVGGFVTKQAYSCWQHERPFEPRHQIVESGPQHRNTDRNTAWRADQMQTPAKGLLLFAARQPQ
jgi:hypothetical protein